jgi:hypothetical protein
MSYLLTLLRDFRNFSYGFDVPADLQAWWEKKYCMFSPFARSAAAEIPQPFRRAENDAVELLAYRRG